MTAEEGECEKKGRGSYPYLYITSVSLDMLGVNILMLTVHLISLVVEVLLQKSRQTRSMQWNSLEEQLCMKDQRACHELPTRWPCIMLYVRHRVAYSRASS